jgi:hypothetical protein
MAKRTNVSGLNDTMPLMVSNDYKDRFVAEYMQTKIRYNKLHRMIVRYEAGTLDFKPTCPLFLLKEQAEAMGAYLFALEKRAELEGIHFHISVEEAGNDE